MPFSIQAIKKFLQEEYSEDVLKILRYKMLDDGLLAVFCLPFDGTYKTNDSRHGIVDNMYAMFGSTRLCVLCIFDIYTFEKHKSGYSYYNKWHNRCSLYEVGKIACSEECNDNPSDNDHIIHYYKTIEGAINEAVDKYYLDRQTYTGVRFQCDTNGKKISSTEYLNGQWHGTNIYYNSNGSPSNINVYEFGEFVRKEKIE